MLDSVSLAVLVLIFAFLWFREVVKRKNAENRQPRLISEARADAIKRSRSSLEGAVYEQLVPQLPEWHHTPSEARFLGDPVDYIVFEGLSTGEPTQITIVEIKKGNSNTTKVQNKIRDLIKDGKVAWELIKID